MIHTMTGGIPRAINILCHAALVYGFADEIPIIGTQVIDEIKADTGESGFGVDRWFEDEYEEQNPVNSYRPAETPSGPAPASNRSGRDELGKTT